MKLLATLLRLKFLLIKHGPNAERGFGLVTGGVFALLLVGLATPIINGTISADWLLVCLTAWGVMWLLAPLIQPTYTAPLLQHEWFRSLPHSPYAIVAALGVTELFGVGPLITVVAFASLLIPASVASGLVMTISIAAVIAQVMFLIWLGKATAAVVQRFMQLRFGRAIAATQMSLLLAISFAGWIPIAALLSSQVNTGIMQLSAGTIAADLPTWLENILLQLPTGWGFAAVWQALGGNPGAAMAYIAALVGLTIMLWRIWFMVTVQSLRQPPARQVSGLRLNAKARTFSAFLPDSQLQATLTREIKTWFRDPVRSLELRHAWLTPIFMAVIVWLSGWDWALPFTGVAFAVFGAMVAVNTYALDGTAFWQLLTTPGALKADLYGRYLAWLVLFGAPAIISTLLLGAVSGSPLTTTAIGATLAAIATGCTIATLLAVVMPAIGTDARQRVRLGQRAGDATGGQMTVFPAVLLGAALPVIIAVVAGYGAASLAPIIAGLLVAVAIAIAVSRLTNALLQRRQLQFYTLLLGKA
ncbi:MAG TPA: hypothetical protein VD907_03525 [Verrucomicrobiae bacterium]|nr:hypothetical protein [Verrucomicrobiae bacterium]